ncbi:hypothetical protein N9D31_00685 [Oligoflexaceae bacterium]|nr:hypothetical protein [Oligoflexaceae bacterium]
MNKIFVLKNGFENSGMTLGTVLLAVSLIGSFAYFISSMGSDRFLQAHTVKMFSAREDLRDMIRVRTDCSKTTSDTSNTKIKDSAGQNSFASSGSDMTFGDWKFRIMSISGKRIDISAKHKTESSYKNLFQADPFICD